MEFKIECKTKLQAPKINIGEHFWCLINGENELTIGLKTKKGIYVCGDWEGLLDESELHVIEIIDKPKEFKNSKLAYNY